MRPATRDTNPVAPLPCYHCGEPVPRGLDLNVEIAGEQRAMCCPGCSAVASLIAGSGLERFYEQRTAYNERPDEPDAALIEQFLVYDDPELAATFTTTDNDGLLNAGILLGGVSCAACTWLIEQSLGALPGVTRALVNLQQSRLDIQFDPKQRRLSEVFARLNDLGYQPRPFKSSTQRQQLEEEYRTDLRRLAVAGLAMMQVGMFAVALHAGDIQGIEAQYRGLLRWVSFPVAGFVVLYSARPFFSSAWRHLSQGALVMDLPVALAIGLAFLASAWGTISGTGQVYFDSVVMFTFFLLLGRFLERRMRQRHLFTWFDAQTSLPAAVTVRRDEQWATVPRLQAQVDDVVLIRPGATVAVDAEILAGQSAVQEDTFNGEHLPRAVTAGDTIYAGTINIESAIEARVLCDYRDSRLAALQQSVEAAQTAKPHLARFADRIAAWFVAGILLVSSITAFAWFQIAPDKALWVTLSVLVISCPCALALATPAALTSAASALRSRGVVVRGENAIESLAQCTHLLLDKTGTLTEGTLVIDRVQSLSGASEEEILGIAAALQHYSNHPIARAFSTINARPGFEQIDYQIGAGLEGHRLGTRYRVGSAAFCRELATEFPRNPDDQLYWVGLCNEAGPLAWIGLSDRTRGEAAGVINAAQKAGLQLELLTGDSSRQGELLANRLGIDSVYSGMTPQQKMARVQTLQDRGAIVTMVGDGLNDAPVLSLANASFAVAGATDLARTQADFVIVDGDLHKVITSLKTARQCRRVILQNFSWALAYNACGIPLAALGYIPPWAAAIGMSLSSLLVVANSLRLNR